MPYDLISSKVADFVIKNSDGIYTEEDRIHIQKYIGLHISFGTLLVVRDKGDIIGVCRWNWIGKDHVKVLDLIIREDFRFKNIARNMLIKAKMAMPGLKHISFQRKKYAMRTSRIEVSRWLKEIINEREVKATNHRSSGTPCHS